MIPSLSFTKFMWSISFNYDFLCPFFERWLFGARYFEIEFFILGKVFITFLIVENASSFDICYFYQWLFYLILERAAFTSLLLKEQLPLHVTQRTLILPKLNIPAVMWVRGGIIGMLGGAYAFGL